MDDPLVTVDRAVAPFANQVCVTKAQLVLLGLGVTAVVALLMGMFDQKVKIHTQYGGAWYEGEMPKGWLRKSGVM